MILIPDDGSQAPSHIHLTAGMPSLKVPALPYAEPGLLENLVTKLGLTRMMSCKQDTLECWTLKLGDDAWVPHTHMLLRHQWNECRMDFGSDIMLFGGGGT